MKTFRIALAAAVIAAAAAPQAAPAATYAIDATHSQVTFKVKHLGISTVTGRFEAFAGAIELDPQTMAVTGAQATLEAASINTGVEKRDNHLRSADFFEVETYPQITFQSRGVTRDGESLKITGDLTLHGVTKAVELTAVPGGVATDPWGNERFAITATTTINRKDFGLTWNQVLESGGLLVSEDVEIELDIQGIRQASGE